MADDWERELSFEVSARSNLDVVADSVLIEALDDFSVDFSDVSFP